MNKRALSTLFYLSILISAIFIVIIQRSQQDASTLKSVIVTPEHLENEELLKEEMIGRTGKVTLNLGLFNLEYFADRMVYKSKKVGYDIAIKKNIGTSKNPLYKVYIDNLDLEKAKEIQQEILKIVPDLKSNIKQNRITHLLM